ncbi:DEAD/DEAH box helicase [Leptolyngbya sp. 'hensonii']|uniref:DEAD/DEAH box helicase n=1 Tax=Leptolyngbya sp. 'hensonii' TaxID=1922337 RepID=UPI00094FAAB9|nr:RNA helicase [Leptolyngbya sp. 'hensonii']OLP15983.1 DEAD/DEAH box helicase [Leptolyngbya sp. 'hensonii']
MSVSPASPQLKLKDLFPFELDDFQQQAVAALNAGHSVVVCAPTGSGKTLVGEYAIHRALACGKRVFYTTPLKALSNQKLRDFRELFGMDQVGLLTGDISINRDAPILVMTTEIFRNMLYGTRIGEVGTSLVGVETVVLDECHYMNDRQRGTVWEESIIYCPTEIQLVALSATIANSEQLTDWISQVHGPTDLIYSDFRPVPLRFYFGNPKGLFPLLNDNQTKINPKLKSKGPPRRQDSPLQAFVLSQLQQRDMLPAIYFIFSRRGCDQAVASLSGISLLNEAETRHLKQEIDTFLLHYPEVARSGLLDALYRGIASHHAGLLPAWKRLVEELFQQGLIKVVFATETLAAGINMPARTTVVSSLSKRTDRGHRLLNPSEFLQMAGRAGRRGMDQLGHVVTLQSPFEGSKEAAYLATSSPDPLVSQFAPSYGMVLNLLQTHTLEEARELVERSFGQYLSTLYLKPQQQAIADLQAELAQQEVLLGEAEPKLLGNYEKLQERLKEERRLLKTLQQQAMGVRASDMAIALAFAVAGTILSLKGEHVPTAEPLPAVLVAKIAGSGQFPYLICISQENRWHVVTVGDVVGLHGEFPRIAAVDHLPGPPAEMPLKPGQQRSGSELTAAIARQIPAIPSPLEDPEIVAQLQVVNAVQAQLENHPARKWGDPVTLVKRQRRITVLKQEIEQRQAKLGKESHRHWEEFLNLIEVLKVFDCLEEITDDHTAAPEAVVDRQDSIDRGVAQGLRPTPLGQSAATIRGDNELWLGLALTFGSFERLEPHHLAGACAALVTESSRPDTWTRYELSGAVEEALEGLWETRRRLIKVQHHYGVDIMVLPAKWQDQQLAALVEQWAAGVEWSELCSNTSLDEGDVVRILRRTLDLLSQIPHVPHLSKYLQRNAIRAMELIDRFPVNEIAE